MSTRSESLSQHQRSGQAKSVAEAVAQYVKAHSGCTRAEIAEAVDPANRPSNITNPVQVLIKLGHVKVSGTILDPDTGRRVEVLAWISDTPGPRLTSCNHALVDRLDRLWDVTEALTEAGCRVRCTEAGRTLTIQVTVP